MPLDQLIVSLHQDSQRSLEPFNSTAYREVIKRGRDAAPAIAGQPPDSIAFLDVLALRQLDRARYSSLNPGTRARILVGALAQAPAFNAWGLPHAYSEAAADAVVELGRPARPYLIKLLGNERRAPVWGSEEAAESARYAYRVKDYAWWLLSRIDGRQQSVIPIEPARRDSIIQGYPK